MTKPTSRPFTAASFNQFLAEEKLMASRCLACEAFHLPPRAICPQCHSQALEWVAISGQGKLAAFTSIYIAPTFMIEQGFDRNNPYLTGIVELAEGPKISARILGLEPSQPEQAWIGTPLAVEFLSRGEDDQKQIDLAFRVHGRE